MFDHCVHFFATAEYLMNDSRIKEVYSLKGDISWMNDAQQDNIDHAEMNIISPRLLATFRSSRGPMMIRHARASGCGLRRSMANTIQCTALL